MKHRFALEHGVNGAGTLWASPVNALPWPYLFSKRARHCWPLSWLRSNRTAASEKAHVREALPIFVPEGPERLPADALAH